MILVIPAGYIGSVGLLQVIKRVVLALRAVNPGLVYVCDPVLGDDGKLYLPAQMVDLYRYFISCLTVTINSQTWPAWLLHSDAELCLPTGSG